MKTSNKILLGMFFTIILLITSVHLVVYAKYKRGNYVAFQRSDLDPSKEFDIPAVRFVSVNGLGHFSIGIGPKSNIYYNKNKSTNLTYRVLNDTLFIEGDSSLNSEQLEKGQRNYNLVRLTMPTLEGIDAAYSNFEITGDLDTPYTKSYVIILSKQSNLSITRRGNERMTYYFKGLHISSTQSNIELEDFVFVDSMNLKLVQSKLDDKNAAISNLTIDSDRESKLSLSGKNFKALK